MKVCRHSHVSILVLAVALSATACKKKNNDDATGTVTGSQDPLGGGTDLEAVNALASAYPGGLAVSVFPQTTGSGLRLADEDNGQTMKEKAEEAEAILKGEGECLPPMFDRDRAAGNVSCYEFDQEMIYGNRTNQQVSGTRDGKDAAGEACLVSFARSKVASIESMVDRALGLVQAMMCQAKKDGKADSMPAAAGDSLDLAEQLTAAMGNKVGSVTTASIKRLADQSDRPVYRSDVVVEMADGTVQEMHLVHSPESADSNDTYNGVLWTKRISSTSTPNLQGGPAGPKNEFVSLQYAKNKNDDGSYNAQSELLRGMFHDDLVDIAIQDDGTLDLNAGAKFDVAENNPAYGNYVNPVTNQPFNQSNDAVSGISYVAFNMNPDDNSGTVSYWANPGGNYVENARGMVFNLVQGDDGYLKGCGTTGATGSSPNNGFSIRQSKREASADKSLVAGGFYHPSFNTESLGSCTSSNGSDVNGDYIATDCTDANQEAKWYKPTGVDAALASQWTTQQMGSIISRQCVVQGADGSYGIDADETSAAAGFDLIDTSTTAGKAESVAAPDLSGLKSLVVE